MEREDEKKKKKLLRRKTNNDSTAFRIAISLFGPGFSDEKS